MADEEKKEDKAEKKELTPEEQDAKSSKRKKLILIIGGIVAAAAIGGGAFFFIAGGDNQMAAKSGTEDGTTVNPEEESESETAEATGEEDAEQSAKPAEGEDGDEEASATPEETGIDFGCTHNFKPFHLNLGNPLENRYIRFEISVEFGCADVVKTELDKRLPQLRDAVISVVGSKTREALLSPDGKAQLTKEIHNRLNHYMTNKLDNVFITDILIE